MALFILQKWKETEYNSIEIMKPTLHFIVNWLPGNKERSWSGTNWGLYKALQKYFEVSDININRPLPLKKRILRKLGFTITSDLGISDILANRKRVTPLLNSQEANNRQHIAFQFAEIVNDSPLVKTYIYQDLAVPYIEYMYEHLPEDYAVSAYQDIPMEYVHQRAKTQMEYYHTCSGIFTMGKWLKRYLVEECQLSKCKIMSIGGVLMLTKI